MERVVERGHLPAALRHGYPWQPWGRRRSRELRRRGIRREWAWTTVQSAQGPWRISRRPALELAHPGRSFDGLGLPRLQPGSQR